jgi:CBS-domain-containing membrane protein
VSDTRDTVKPVTEDPGARRRRIGLWQELKLALLPTVTVIAVLVLLEFFVEQRLLFASLASSAFLIYLDPHHATNTTKTLVISHLIGATVGLIALNTVGPGYLAAAAAMAVVIVVLVVLDVVHPPAISTALAFAFRPSADDNFALFALAVGMTAVLVLMQRAVLFLLARGDKR